MNPNPKHKMQTQYVPISLRVLDTNTSFTRNVRDTPVHDTLEESIPQRWALLETHQRTTQAGGERGYPSRRENRDNKKTPRKNSEKLHRRRDLRDTVRNQRGIGKVDRD